MATTTRNPFEPPRTTDLDVEAAPGPMVVSTEALRELTAAAPWIGALARLTMLTIAIEAFALVGGLARAHHSAQTTLLVIVRATNIGMFTLFVLLLRRYAAASLRLRDGGAAAIGPVLAAQAAYLKRARVVAAIATGLFVLFLAVRIGSGRFLGWVH